MNVSAPVKNQTFVGANVQVDGGVAYENCKFVRCNLVITGMAPMQVVNTTFEGCQWSFAGAAAMTLSFLKAMYANPESREIVEMVIRGIRGDGQALIQNPTPTPAGSVVQ